MPPTHSTSSSLRTFDLVLSTQNTLLPSRHLAQPSPPLSLYLYVHGWEMPSPALRPPGPHPAAFISITLITFETWDRFFTSLLFVLFIIFIQWDAHQMPWTVPGLWWTSENISWKKTDEQRCPVCFRIWTILSSKPQASWDLWYLRVNYNMLFWVWGCVSY